MRFTYYDELGPAPSLDELNEAIRWANLRAAAALDVLVANAVALTPVQYRHRLTIVYQDGYRAAVASLLPT